MPPVLAGPAGAVAAGRRGGWPGGLVPRIAGPHQPVQLGQAGWPGAVAGRRAGRGGGGLEGRRRGWVAL